MVAVVRLVLSGGSAKGLLECAGAVCALEDRGHTIGVGAGTSAGGIVLGALASGRAPSEVKNILFERDFTDFVSTGWLSWLRLATRGNLSNGKALLDFLRDFTRYKTFAEAHFDVRLTASDYTAGCMRVFRPEEDPTMEIALAMRATSAMPLAFSAIEYEDRWYKDGGVYAHVPVDAGTRAPDERTVIFALAQPPGVCKNAEPWRMDVGLVREVGRTVDLLVDANVEAQMVNSPEDAVTVFSDALGYGTLDFALGPSDKQALFEHGYALTAEALEAAGL